MACYDVLENRFIVLTILKDVVNEGGKKGLIIPYNIFNAITAISPLFYSACLQFQGKHSSL